MNLYLGLKLMLFFYTKNNYLTLCLCLFLIGFVLGCEAVSGKA